jgi:hypothetical protein
MKPFYIFYESGPIQMMLGIQGTFLQKIVCYELDGREIHSKVRVEALGNRLYKDGVLEEFRFEFETSLFKYAVTASFVEREGQLYLVHYKSKQVKGGAPFDAFVMLDPEQAQDLIHRELNSIQLHIIDSLSVPHQHWILPEERGVGKIRNRAERRSAQ